MPAKPKRKKAYYRSTFTYEGKRHERKSAKSQRGADRKADQLLEPLRRGERRISGDMTVGRWGAEWLETYKRSGVGEGQRLNYE
jgi:hypothetical protein